jgi:hypothetical protein
VESDVPRGAVVTAASTGAEAETNEPLPKRRRWVWVCVVLGLVVLLVLLPPLVNVNSLRRRMAASMSASLGRPVTMDRVSLHVLPVPGFTLENLVVSEDPGFGSEPMIRANTVEVRLRPTSLWRKRVEISSIKFVEPSLNLVRNAGGEWNLQSLLMHAASVDTAPTVQRKAGPAPRFPYIEATGARVNLKLGEEKKPFSLTEADFALWSPTAQQWQVRVEGKPARTDTNISDPGTVKLDGTLERAATMAAVPVDLTASWEDVPLGEVSKVLSGADAGWRGNLVMSARLTGELGAAKLTTRAHVEELRREDFVPVQTMDLHTECSGTLGAVGAVLNDADCSLNAPLDDGEKVAGRVVALADRVDLSALSVSGLRVGMTNIHDSWLLDWVRLFSQRIPAGERPGGTVAGSVALNAHSAWQGEVHGDVVGKMPWKDADGDFVEHPISLTSSDGEFVLTPLSLMAEVKAQDSKNSKEPDSKRHDPRNSKGQDSKTPGLVLSGTVTRSGYTVRLAGAATMEQVDGLRKVTPPLGDGLDQALSGGGDAEKAMKIDVTCRRSWGAAQTCAATASEAPKRRHRRQ